MLLTLFGWFTWLIIGAVVGLVANYSMRTHQRPINDIVIGILGAFIGGFLFNLVGIVGVLIS